MVHWDFMVVIGVEFSGQQMTVYGDEIMIVPEPYKQDFVDLIQRERDGVLRQIEQIIAHHGEGTYEEERANAYSDFLYDILRNIE